ncbi:MAG: ferritin family protein [Candidatus Diapherotrites archaeon]
MELVAEKGKSVAVSAKEKKFISAGLAIAEELESRAISFYGKASKKKGVRPDLKDLFSLLIQEEKNHLKVIKALEKIMKKQGAFERTKVKGKTPAKKIFRKGKDFSRALSSGEISMGLWALEAERLSRQFYESMAKKSKTPAAKGFFSQLAAFEKRHYKMIDDALEQIAGTEGLFST